MQTEGSKAAWWLAAKMEGLPSTWAGCSRQGQYCRTHCPPPPPPPGHPCSRTRRRGVHFKQVPQQRVLLGAEGAVQRAQLRSLGCAGPLGCRRCCCLWAHLASCCLGRCCCCLRLHLGRCWRLLCSLLLHLRSRCCCAVCCSLGRCRCRCVSRRWARFLSIDRLCCSRCCFCSFCCLCICCICCSRCCCCLCIFCCCSWLCNCLWRCRRCRRRRRHHGTQPPARRLLYGRRHARVREQPVGHQAHRLAAGVGGGRGAGVQHQLQQRRPAGGPLQDGVAGRQQRQGAPVGPRGCQLLQELAQGLLRQGRRLQQHSASDNEIEAACVEQGKTAYHVVAP